MSGLIVDLLAAVFLGVCWAAYFQVPLPGIARFLQPAKGPITFGILGAATVILAILLVAQIARLH